MTDVTRAEVIAIAAVGLNVLTLVFGAGVMWADIQEHERRISGMEARYDVVVDAVGVIDRRVEGIDSKVDFLVTLAEEERRRR